VAVARRRLVLDDDSLDEAEVDMVSVDPVLCSVCCCCCCCWCALVLDAAPPEEGRWEEPCLDDEKRWWVDDEAAARSSASLCRVCSLLLLRPWEARPEADAAAVAAALAPIVPLTGRRDDEAWLEWPIMPSGTRRARGSGATTSEDAAASCMPPP
jgi:hypothetical protein